MRALVLGGAGLTALLVVAFLVLRVRQGSIRSSSLELEMVKLAGGKTTGKQLAKAMAGAGPGAALAVLRAVEEDCSSLIDGLENEIGPSAASPTSSPARRSRAGCVLIEGSSFRHERGPFLNQLIAALPSAHPGLSIVHEALLLRGGALEDLLEPSRGRPIRLLLLLALASRDPEDMAHVPFVREALNSERWVLRVLGVAAAGRLGRDGAALADLLVQALGDPQLPVRIEAMRALEAMQIRAPRAVLELARAIGREEPEGSLAAKALCALSPEFPQVLPIILEAARHAKAGSRVLNHAALVLFSARGSSLAALASALERENESLPILMAMARRGSLYGETSDSILAPLLRVALSDNGDVSFHALGALLSVTEANGAAPVPMELLLAALRDPSPRIKVLACTGIGRKGDLAGSAVPALLQMLSDPSSDVRSRAAWALGRVGPGGEDGVPALRKALADESDGVRHAAAASLLRSGVAGKDVVRVLRDALIKDRSNLLVELDDFVGEAPEDADHDGESEQPPGGEE